MKVNSHPEGRRVNRQFAQTMRETFDKGARFMSDEHREGRHILLDQCAETGYMSPELEAVFLWTVRDNPNANYRPETREDDE